MEGTRKVLTTYTVANTHTLGYKKFDSFGLHQII